MIALASKLDGKDVCAYLTPNQIAERYGVAPNTARNLLDRGLIPAYVLPSGWRKAKTADVEAYFQSLAVKQEEKALSDGASEESGTVLIYARCSSAGQKADLERQVERLCQYAKDELGCSNPTVYQDIGSGLSETRPDYNRLIGAILSGKYNGATLLLTHKDRLSRFSPGIFLKLCDHAGIRVIFTEAAETVEQSEEMARDVIMILQVYGNRISSARSASRSRVVLTSEQLREAFRLHKVGHSGRDIAKALEGQLSENGKPISHTVISKILRKNGKVLEQLVDTSGEQNSFQRFEAENIKRTSKPTLVSKKRIVEVYLAWCQNNGEQAISEKNIGSYYKRKGIETRYSRSGSLLYVGLSLITNKGD